MGSPSTLSPRQHHPGRDAHYGVLVALADLEPGIAATVRRISEVAEHEAPALLAMLPSTGFMRAAKSASVESNVGPNDLALSVAGEELTLSLGAAQLIWVERI